MQLALRLLVLPWTLLVAGVRLTANLLGLPARLRSMTAGTLVCPAHHPNALMGRWTCACGATYLGHVFGPCPVCGMPAGWVKCERCGLAIRSPWKDD